MLVKIITDLMIITELYSKDINMEFGLDKCKTFKYKMGKLV